MVSAQDGNSVRDGTLTCTLICVALGVVLGPTASRIRAWGLVAFGLSASLTNLVLAGMSIRSGWADVVFLNSWVSVLGCAASVYLRRPIGIFAALVLSINGGLWCGAVSSLTGSTLGVLKALPAVAVLWPVGWATRYRNALAVKVVAGWLAAVAVLAATLQFLPVTPGYVPDHLE